MQENIDNLQDKLKEIKNDQEKYNILIEQIKDKFLDGAKEKTIAYYINKVSNGLSRDVGEKAPHNVKTQLADPNFENMY